MRSVNKLVWFSSYPIRSWNVSRSAKSPENPHKFLFWRSWSFKIIEFGGNRKPLWLYDCLSMINSNLSFISHHYWDTATYWLKNSKFSYPFFHLAPQNLWKSCTVPETWVFQAVDSRPKDLVILACTVFDWSTRVTDRQTDRQNCDG